MSVIKPSSTITLYRDILNGPGSRPIFQSFENQKAYFKRHQAAEFVRCSYVRHSKNELKINFKPSVVQNCNYISFVNPDYENWVYFAEITEYEYISNDVCKIKYSIDWFQSYMFDVKYEMSYIERQHLLQKTQESLNKNPWLDVYEMFTDEDIPVSDSMFKGGVRDGNEVAVHFGKPCIVFKVTPYNDDTSFASQWHTEIRKIAAQDGGFIKDTKGVESHFSGLDVRGNSIPPATFDFKYPKVTNPSDIIILPDSEGAREHLEKLLEMLSVNNMSHGIVGMWTVPTMYVSCWLLWNSTNPGQKLLSIKKEDRNTPKPQPRASNVGDKFTVQLALPHSSYRNAKLLRSPYTYMFVEADGNRKEWRFEDFKRFSSDGKHVMFDVITSFDNAPFISIVPFAYQRVHPDDADSRTQYNISERLDIVNIPQMAYSTDSFLAFLGQQYTSQLANTTVKAANTKQSQNIYSGVEHQIRTQGVRGLVQKGMEFISPLIGGMQEKGNIQNNELNRDRDTWTEISDYKSGLVNGDYKSGVFGNAKSAYALDEYHAGSGNVLGAYTGPTYNVPSGFIYGFNTLRDSIGHAIDGYFDYYGYTCNYIQTPRVVNYMFGGDQPYFVNNQTYCKTSNMRISHSLKIVCEYISQVFNSGCHFYRGENL